MHNGNEPLPVLMSPPMMMRILVIGKGQELHQASLSHTMKSTTIGKNTRAHIQDREGKTSSEVPSTHVHHLQWSNGPCRTCEPVQPEDGYPL